MTKLADNQPITKAFTKTDLITHLANVGGVPRKKIDELLQALVEVVRMHIKGGFIFSFMSLLKFYVVEKPFTPERKGANPFTGEMTTFPAKPAHKAVRVKPLKKLKEMANEESEG